MNRKALGPATGLCLRQHADHPVHRQPSGGQAVPVDILRGKGGPRIVRWRDAARAVDRVHCYAVGQAGERLAAPMAAKNDAVTASVCLGQRCLPPVGALDAFLEQLRSAG